MSLVENLEALLAKGQDSALLRYSLGNAYLDQGQLQPAITHFSQAVQLDPQYSSAWKQYGKALTQAGQAAEAIEVYRKGIQVAEANGDKQAAKEMQVFHKRLLQQTQQQ